MPDSKDPKDRSSELADHLIQEALENLDEREEVGAIQSASNQKTDNKEVAKIDLQQFVPKEAYMRLAADFDNFRKRALKERSEWERLGKEKALRGALDLIDHLAIGLAQAKDDSSPLATGMQMVLSQAETWLQTEGLEKVPAVGEVFDPNLHEAVAQVVDSSKKEGQIIEEVKRGYRWKDRLLRPASVVVVKASSDEKD